MHILNVDTIVINKKFSFHHIHFLMNNNIFLHIHYQETLKRINLNQFKFNVRFRHLLYNSNNLGTHLNNQN